MNLKTSLHKSCPEGEETDQFRTLNKREKCFLKITNFVTQRIKTSVSQLATSDYLKSCVNVTFSKYLSATLNAVWSSRNLHLNKSVLVRKNCCQFWYIMQSGIWAWEFVPRHRFSLNFCASHWGTWPECVARIWFHRQLHSDVSIYFFWFWNIVLVTCPGRPKQTKWWRCLTSVVERIEQSLDLGSMSNKKSMTKVNDNKNFCEIDRFEIEGHKSERRSLFTSDSRDSMVSW